MQAPPEQKLSVPKHVREVRNKVLEFVETHVYALEKELDDIKRDALFAGSDGERVKRAKSSEAMKRVQALAKEQGLWALGHPKEIGGQGMKFSDYLYVNEVQGRSELGMVALGTHSLQDSLMLVKYAPLDLQEKYVSRVVAADLYPSFAMTEPDVTSSDPTQLQTEGRLEGEEWVINGTKWWTTNADGAAFTSVMVRTEFEDNVAPHAAFSIILVPTDTPGYNIVGGTHVLETEGSHGIVQYENVRVPRANLLGKRGQGFSIAQERLGPGRAFHMMRWIGQAQRAFDLMCVRLQERKLRGGGLLGEAQLMQEHVYESFCDIHCLRLLALSAAEKMDAGGNARLELSAAKAWGARALGRVIDRAIQVYGAKGLTELTPLSSMHRHARAARFYDGPDEVHISSVGRLLLSTYKGGGSRYDFSEGKAVHHPKGKL